MVEINTGRRITTILLCALATLASPAASQAHGGNHKVNGVAFSHDARWSVAFELNTLYTNSGVIHFRHGDNQHLELLFPMCLRVTNSSGEHELLMSARSSTTGKVWYFDIADRPDSTTDFFYVTDQANVFAECNVGAGGQAISMIGHVKFRTVF